MFRLNMFRLNMFRLPFMSAFILMPLLDMNKPLFVRLPK